MAKSSALAPVHYILIGTIAVVMIRIILVFSMGLMPQDAYYYLYSEYLSLSYFDHPPMVAWFLRLSYYLFGKTVIGVKLTDFLLTSATVVAFYHLARQFFQGFRIERALYLLLSTMMISILSLVTTPDVPLMLFWTLSVYFIYRAIQEDRVYLWILAGFMSGLAFDSKYTALLLWVGLFGYLITFPPKRKLLSTYRPYLAVIIFVLTIAPVIIWNIQHDWISFRFQTSGRLDGMNAFRIHIKYFLGNIGTQLFLIIPILYVFLITALYKVTKDYLKNPRLPDMEKWFLWWFSAPFIVGFMVLSLFYWVKLNWTMPGYIAGILLATYIIPHRWVRMQVMLSAIFHFVFLIQVFYYPFPVQSDDTWWGWDQLAKEVTEIHRTYPETFVFSNDGYKTSAILSFYMDQKIYAGNVVGEEGLQFSIIDPDLNNLKGQDAIFIDSEKRFRDLEKSPIDPVFLGQYFSEVTELEPIVIYDAGGEPERKFMVYFLQGYRGVL